MPTLTTNVQRSKLLTSEDADVAVLKGNMDKLDNHRHLGGADGLPVRAGQNV